MRCPSLSFFVLIAFTFFTQVLAKHFHGGLHAYIRSTSDDSFYHPPSGWENKQPGTILRSRKVDITNFGILKLGVTGYQLLYRTNSIDPNTPMTTVTTVLVPDNYDNDKLVVAGVYEDSYSSDCAPSKRLASGNNIFKNVAISYQEMFYTTLLHEGWVVTVPDHEGPHSAFTSGRLEGHAILDAIRATLKYDTLGLDSNSKVVGYGYSGGALATGWAAGLQRKYASELNVVGWSLGGTVANMTRWLNYIDGTSGAGFAVASVGGLSSTYPELSWIQDSLTQQGEAALDRSSHLCMYENLWAMSYKKFLSNEYFEGGDDFFVNDQVREVLQKLDMGRYSIYAPTAPVFMFHATHDEVVPYSMAADTANAWCDQGSQVRFLTVTGLEMSHTNTELLNLPNVLFFMRDRFNDKPWGDRCQRDSISDPILNPLSLGQSLTQVVQQVIDLLGTRIGPADSIMNAKISSHQIP
ncbi:Lipase [Malassezia pachydermatis]|uniref:triacylglycerol lipase n=2 Tax=Malassezia pachydermatis TaxID=77020 RepID=A0A0M8MSL1_9BASI|nr:putative secretory lipase (family lip) [Malassezia pachydermatis]KOS12801.1 putative secretory lipase (family lip) [Malassezia pachydermatis]